MAGLRTAPRYAKALLVTALEQNALDAVHADVLFLQDLISKSSDFAAMLKSPIIYADKKQAVIDTITSGKVNKVTDLFIKLVIRKGREVHLDSITSAFIELYNEHMEITPIEITTAVPVGKDVIDHILAKVKTTDGVKNVELTTNVDPDLIGGFVLKYNNKLLDSSVSNSLDELSKGFIKNKYVREF